MEFNFSGFSVKNAMVKKTLLAALVSLSMASAHASHHLQPVHDTDIVVTSMGIDENTMTFNVKYDNAEGEKLILVIADKDGTNLYKEIISDKNISKTFKLSSDLGPVFLIVSNMNDKSRRKFEISTERRLVENVLITSIR